MKHNCTQFFILFFVSVSSFSLAMEDLRVSLLSDDALSGDVLLEQDGNNSTLTKNQKKLMDSIRNGEGTTWLQVKVGNTDFEDEYGNTPLMVAAAHNRTDLIPGLLLFDYTSINKQNNEGNTALMLAAMYGYANVVGQLLGYYNVVDVDIQNSDGKTALDLAKEGGYEQVVRMIKGFKKKKLKYGLAR